MSRPRQVLPGSFYLLTRSCTQRQFLLRPDEETNNAFIYCMVDAANRFEIDLILPMAESNHHHTVLFDRHGRISQFAEHFHKLVARCLNVRWGRSENLWAAEEPCLTRLETRAAVIDKLIYAASNPVKDHLVDEVRQWPGVNGYQNLVRGTPLVARRPRYFFRDKGVMPEEVSRFLVIPAELGAAEAVIAEVKAGVEEVERTTREARIKTGGRVLGPRQVCAQPWWASPSSVEPRSALRPRFAGGGEPRLAALVAYKEFLVAYRAARKDWLDGIPSVFPPGTYWLARFARVEVEPAIPRPLY